MATEKEILTRFFKGDSQRTISAALRVSRNTVAKVVKACHEQQLEAAAVDCLDSETLHRHLFPEDVSLPVQVQPDYECIHKELLKSGVTLKLLWDEYAADCQQAKKLYFMYSQFCKRYRDCVDLHRLTPTYTDLPCIFITSLASVSWSTGLVLRCHYTIQKQVAYQRCISLSRLCCLACIAMPRPAEI